MKRLIVIGDERSLRYAFSIVTGKGLCSSDEAVAKLSRYAHMSGSDIYGGERGRSILPVQRMILGPSKSQVNYDTFTFTYGDMEAFLAFLRNNGATCTVATYGTADDFPEVNISFDDALLDKLGVSV